MQDILKKEKYDNSKFYNANVEWLADENNKGAWDTMWMETLGARYKASFPKRTL